jgi:hypothetical protein
MAYQYLQALPQIAAGASNKIWIVPAELTKALEGIAGAFGGLTLGGPSAAPTEAPVGEDAAADAHAAAAAASESAAAAAAAAAEAGETAALPASPGTSVADVLREQRPDRA